MNNLGKVTKTGRGFQLIEFKDLYGEKCSLQESSLASDDAIWLGLSKVTPKVTARDANKVGVKTSETTGWVPYPIPDEVFISARMHLNRTQVLALIKHLQSWVDSSKF